MSEGTAVLQMPPAAIEAEVAVLGALINKSEVAADVVSILDPADFFRPAHGVIFKTIFDMLGRGEYVDLVTVKGELARLEKLEAIGGVEYLATLDTPTPSAAHIYAREVAESSRRRKAVVLARRIIDAGGVLDGEVDALARLREVESAADLKRWPAPITDGQLAEAAARGVEWLIEPLIARGQAVQFAGKPKTGKSELLLAIAVALARGAWPWGEWIIQRPAVVGYVAFEDGPSRIARRLKRYGPGNRPILWPSGRCPMFALPVDERAVARFIREYRLEVLVVDTQAYTIEAGKDENSASDMAPWGAAVKRLSEGEGCAILFSHHARKSGGGRNKRDDVREGGRGSSAILGAMDALVSVERAEDGERLDVVLASKDGAGGPWFIEYDQTATPDGQWRVTHQAEDLREVREEAIKTAIRKGHGKSLSTIASASKLSKSEVGRITTRLKDAGAIKLGPEGWVLD